jgi:hypothetical protein
LGEIQGEYELLSNDYQIWILKKWQRDPQDIGITYTSGVYVS